MANKHIEKVFFDMDGVLADFDRGVNELAGFKVMPQDSTTEEEENQMWAAIASVPHFYDKLEIMPGAKEMFDYIYGIYGDRCEVLTGIPKESRGIVTAVEDKTSWMHRNFNPDIKVNAVLKKYKKNFCKGEGYILIDDFESNISNWESVGGTGILHTDPEITLKFFKS